MKAVNIIDNIIFQTFLPFPYRYDNSKKIIVRINPKVFGCLKPHEFLNISPLTEVKLVFIIPEK